ncbi:unnamed protein product [Ascophyllum nodosum]
MARDPRDDALLLFDMMEMLLRQKLYHSAEIVGGILLSRASIPSQEPEEGLHAEALSMFAEVLSAKGEHRRATMYCKQSLLHRKLQKDIASAPGSAFTPTPSSGSSSRQSSWADRRKDNNMNAIVQRRSDRSKLQPKVCAEVSSSSWSFPDPLAPPPPRHRVRHEKDNFPVAEVKFLEAQCLIAAGENGAAISALEGIPQFARTPVMNATLGRVYDNKGLKRSAGPAYKRTLRENPMAVEAIVPLLEMGVPKEEVLKIIDTALQEAPWGFTRSDLPWLTLYVNGHAGFCCCKAKEALANFARLDQLYPTNLEALLRVAKAHMDLDQWDESLSVFKKARMVDEMNVDLMDCYGVVMRQKEMPFGLNRLANELLSADPNRAEAWVVMALYSEVRGEKEKAASFVDKALELKQNYALASILKGSLLLAERNFEAAPRFFLQANKIRKDIYSYRGLVNAYLQAGKYREAGLAAKEANEMMPDDARTVLLTGNVWEHVKGGMIDNRHKARTQNRRDSIFAKRAYEKALRLDPSYLDATLALVGLHMEDKNYDACVQLLRKAVPNHTRDTLHTKLAEVYTLNRQFDEALESFHFAISLNPSCTNATQGLERLEKLMRGVDPDDEDEDGESGGDADGAGDASASRTSYGGGEYHPSSPTY